MILLGSGGWIPTASRATCSALVRRGAHALLIDAGTGVGRLAEDPALLDGVEQLDIVLSHFHLDHVVGLAYLPALDLPERPRVHGPGRWLYGTPTAGILGRLLAPPLFVGVEAITATVDDFGPEGLSIGPFTLAVRVQRRHSDPTVGFRLDDELALCTDTARDPDTAAFAAGCAVLAHDTWCATGEPFDLSGHTSARQAGEIASAAGVDRLVMIHLRPGQDERLLLEDAGTSFPSVDVGRDLGSYATERAH